MTKLNLFFAAAMAASLCLTTSVRAQSAEPAATADLIVTADLISSLRTEISILKTVVADLSVENKKLSTLIEQLSVQNAALITDPQTPCAERRDTLQRKLDTLYSLGYDAKHPDIINVTKALAGVETTCAVNTPAIIADHSCVTRIVELEKKLDQLKSLGYKDGHPDVSNVKRTIKLVRSECSASESASR